MIFGTKIILFFCHPGVLYNVGLEDFFALAHGQDIETVELTPKIARLTNDLPEDYQGDPFDRTITATARAMNLILVTADRKIRDAEFCEVEFYPFKPSRA